MITQKAAMTQAVFQPQKCKSGDLIKPIHSFNGKGRPGEEFAKAIFLQACFYLQHITHSKGQTQLEDLFFIYDS